MTDKLFIAFLKDEGPTESKIREETFCYICETEDVTEAVDKLKKEITEEYGSKHGFISCDLYEVKNKTRLYL